MRNWQRTAAAALAILATAPATAADLSVKTAPEFTTGKYGDTVETDVTSLPITATWRDDRLSLKAKLPYLVVTGPGEVVADIGPLGSREKRRKTERGIGDLTLTGAYGIARDVGGLADIDLATAIKLPTASARRGLGTGQTDFAVELDISMPILPTLSFETAAGRRFIGDPAGVELRDIFYGSAQVTLDLTEQLSFGIEASGQQRVIAAAKPIVEVAVFADYRLSPDLTLGAQVFRGFTRDSVDIGLGLSIARRFSF